MLSQSIQQAYERWCKLATEDTDLIDELARISDNEEEIFERFYRSLTFGTGGLRGVIGAGENRMNIYTVRKATQGLANYLNERYENAAVAISFDSRIKSDRFARDAAATLAANGIRVYIFEELQPTPVLSFAVRTLGCQSGIMVTASHNPSKYNGYKCYGPDGCQMTDNDANEVISYVSCLDVFDDTKSMDFEEGLKTGLISYIEPSVLEAFLNSVQKLAVHPAVCAEADLSVIYTPLNGTGNKPVREMLRRMGISRVTVVPEQELPDGNFPTAPYPNPEIRQAFECALKLAETNPADLLLATDPDCDRVGIAVRNDDGYTLMTGNEVGCLLLDYVLAGRKANGTLPKNPVAVSTIVSTPMTALIAEKYGCTLINVLTGFKYIGEQIALLEEKGEEDRFVFGFEESYGYMSGSHVRDKDAVNAAMLVCEMASYYKKQGKTLLQVLSDLYTEHGCFENQLLTAEFEGAKGMEIMQNLMDSLRNTPPRSIAGKQVVRVSDYLESVSEDKITGEKTVITLPKSNVLVFDLEGNNRLIVRPSGTEPKVKAYIAACCADMPATLALAAQIKAAAQDLLQA